MLRDFQVSTHQSSAAVAGGMTPGQAQVAAADMLGDTGASPGAVLAAAGMLGDTGASPEAVLADVEASSVAAAASVHVGVVASQGVDASMRERPREDIVLSPANLLF